MNKEVERFESSFNSKCIEIIILTGSSHSGAGKRSSLDSLWTVSMDFIAYIDCETNQLITEKGRVNWLAQENQANWIHNLKPLTTYRLNIRKHKELTNYFMLIDVLEKDIKQQDLDDLLTKYKKPVILADELGGTFHLRKSDGIFEGQDTPWLSHTIAVTLTVDNESANTANSALKVLKQLLSNTVAWDNKLKIFATKELTTLANDWRAQEGIIDEITADEFIKRISLMELFIYSDGDFDAYFDADGMFTDHAILINGNINGNLVTADIC